MNRTQASYLGIYISQFTLLGVQLPFLSQWLIDRGFNIGDIGAVTGAALIGRLASGPLIGALTDQRVDQHTAIKLVSFVFAIGALIMVAGPAKLMIALGLFLVLWSFGLLVPLGDIGIVNAEAAGLLNYGHIRATGSAAFVLANVAVGALIATRGFGAGVVVMVAAAGATFLFALLLPPVATTRPRQGFRLRVIVDLLSNKAFLLFLVAVASIQASHAFYYAYSIIHWNGLGISADRVGLLWATGVIAEIFIIAKARSVARHISVAILLASGGVGAVIRWIAISSEPSLPLLFIFQTLHALTFAATYLGSIQFIRTAIPHELANTAMTLTSTLSVGALTGVATFASGLIFEAHGAGAGYLSMAALGAAGVAATVALVMTWTGGLVFKSSDRH